MTEAYEDLGTFALDTPYGLDKSGGTSSLRLLQLTDLHIFPQSAKTFHGISLGKSYQDCHKFICQLVQDSSPDLICLTGDIVDGRGPWNGAKAVTEAFRDMIPSFQGAPWIYMPGNHDDDHSPWQRNDLLQIFQLPGCLQKRATGFHHTLLLEKAGTRIRLHIFDSGGNHPDPKIMYECVPRHIVESFHQFCVNAKDKQSANEESRTVVPELVYLHIPTPEYQHLDPIVGQNNLFHAALVGGKLPPTLAKLAWLIRLLKLDRIAGCRRGGAADSGLFDACVDINANSRQQPRIVAMFCGHDHHSDAVYQRRGIFLGYGRSGSHTPPFDWEGKAPNALVPGGRIVEVDPTTGTIVTWIQTASGKEENSYLDMSNHDPRQGCCLPA